MPKSKKEETYIPPEEFLPKGSKPGKPITEEVLRKINAGLTEETIQSILDTIYENRDSTNNKDLADIDPTDGSRHRNFIMEYSYYYETHDKDGNDTSNGMTKQQWVAVKFNQLNELFKETKVTRAIGICHNRDVVVDKNNHVVMDENGVPKKKEWHIHVVAEFKNAKTWRSLYKKYGLSRPQNLQVVKNLTQAYRYLFHISEGAIAKNKTFYDRSEARVYYDATSKKKPKPFQWSNILMPTKTDIMEGILKTMKVHNIKPETILANFSAPGLIYPILDRKYRQKVLLGELTFDNIGAILKKELDNYDMSDDFYDFWTKARKAEYKSAEDAYVRARGAYCLGKSDKMPGMVYSKYDKPYENHLDFIYVSGKGKTGKSAIAENLCQLGDEIGRGYHKVAPHGEGKTYDFADGYAGEECTYIDELKPKDMHLTEFLNIFDPYHYAKINSRNNDSYWFSHRAVATSSTPLNTFAERLVVKSAKGTTHLTNHFLNEANGPDYSNNEFRDRKYQVCRRVGFYIETEPCNANGISKTKYHLFALKDFGSGVSYHIYVDAFMCENLADDDEKMKTAKAVNRVINQITTDSYKPFNDIKYVDGKPDFPKNAYIFDAEKNATSGYLRDIINHPHHDDKYKYLPFAEALRRQTDGTELKNEPSADNPFMPKLLSEGKMVGPF